MIYLYDGTAEGFLCAFLLSYSDRDARVASDGFQLPIGAEAINVATDREKAEKVKERLLSFDKRSMHDLSVLLRSGDGDKEEVALAYFRLLAQKKRPVLEMLSFEAVRRADDCMRRVGIELHRMKGFLRFFETESGALYAAFSPDNDIVDLLVPHFRARLPRFPFVIHDVKRKKAAVWDTQNVFLAPLDKAEVLIAADENDWQNLWRQYYESVNIPSRERLKQMRGYLPVRYMKFMPEFSRKRD